MNNLKAASCCAVAAALLGAAACSTAGDGSRFAPTGPSLDVSVSAQTAQLCKSGPVGTYNFTVSNSGSTNTGDVVVAAPSLTVTDANTPACTTVFTRTQYSGAMTDPAAVLTIVEGAAPGTSLTNITTTGSEASTPVINIAGRSVSVGVNAFHSATATFYNVADQHPLGCTYTQGWYKNHTTQWPSGFSPSATFYGSGLTWIQLYNTPPKGSQYVILAHQYMTALMNASGASVPSAVQSAMDAAETYFTSGTGSIAGAADILDQYNNGLAAGGPGHCD